jgi:purine-binding chemotaxis protein CheW
MSDEKDRSKSFDPPFEDNPLGEVLEEIHPGDTTENAAAYSPLEEILSVDMDFPGSQFEIVTRPDEVVPRSTEPALVEEAGEESTTLIEATAYPPAESDMPFGFLYQESLTTDEAPPEYMLSNGEGAFESSLREPAEVEPEEVSYEEPQQEEPARLEEVINSIDDQLQEGYEEPEPVTVKPVGTQKLKVHQKYVIFSLAGARYAVPLKNVIEIGHRPKTTVLPHVPEWLLGVTNRRGDILSVVDLRAFLGITETNSNSAGRMLVVRTGNDEMTTGLIVDQVNKILDLPADQVQTPTAPIETKLAPYMMGVCEYRDELLAVLDLEPILLSSEMRQFEQV